jgi:hypothetical protein
MSGMLKQLWTVVTEWLAGRLVGVLHFIIRPKISQGEAIEVMQNAARVKGWQIEPIHECDRHMHLYQAMSILSGTDSIVFIMIDGRTGEVLQLERSDEFVESD